MNWSSVGKIVGKSAPIVGSLLAGSVGEKVGSIVANALGVESTPEAVENAINNNPDYLLKLKELEANNNQQLLELQISEAQLYIQDTQDARKRQIEYMKMTGKQDWTMVSLAGLITFGFLIVTGTLIFVPIPGDANIAVMMLFGTLSTAFGAVINYFFGSSAGSKNKSDLIANEITNKR